MTEASKEESQSRFEGETRGVSEGREGKAGVDGRKQNGTNNAIIDRHLEITRLYSCCEREIKGPGSTQS
jgi:hypothetical protein